MSRKKSPEQLDKEMWEAEEARSAFYRKQLTCDHDKGYVTSWDTDKANTLYCPDCQAKNSFCE